MKKLFNKNSIILSAVSLLLLCLFFFLAIGSMSSLEFFNYTGLSGLDNVNVEVLLDGSYRTTYYFDWGSQSRTVQRDFFGRRHGKYERKLIVKGEEGDYINIKGSYSHGLKNGTFITTYGSGTTKKECYKMGIQIECEKAAQLSGSEVSAFEVLNNKYISLVNFLHAFEFSDSYIESFTDTIEIILAESEFEADDFDDYYSEAIDKLEETHFDSIIYLTTFDAVFNGLELMKNSELRLAVIEKYKYIVPSTFTIVKSTYPNYLIKLEQGDVNEQDFEVFSDSLDTMLDSYGPLDPEDTFFIDSIDARLYRAILEILESGESALAEIQSGSLPITKAVKLLFPKTKSVIPKLLKESSSSDVAEVVLYFIFMEYSEGDLLKKAVRESWLSGKEIISKPTVSLIISEYISPTSVRLEGYIHANGGDEINSSGIVWAEYHNPTTADEIESSETNTGAFLITLEGLIEGNTYYARTFATNGAGTAYGNCISFIPSEAAVALPNNDSFAGNFNLYPNPALGVTTIRFEIENNTESVQLSVIDINGRTVLTHEHTVVVKGENIVQLDLSGLPDGLYICKLKNNGITLAKQKLLVTH